MSSSRTSSGRTGAALLLALVLALAACGSENVVTDGALAKDKGVPTIAPATTLPDAAGKPCKAATGVPKATGKPTVEVPVGPPPTKLVKKDLEAGTGAVVKKGDNITFNYVGISCSTGKQFQSSWDEGGKPVTSDLAVASGSGGGLIEGWVEGLPGMKVGGIRQLVIPPAQGYGATGQNGIARNETLIFAIQVDKVNPPGTTTTAPAGSSAPVTTAGSATTTTTGASTSTTTAEGTTTTAAETTTTGG